MPGARGHLQPWPGPLCPLPPTCSRGQRWHRQWLGWVGAAGGGEQGVWSLGGGEGEVEGTLPEPPAVRRARREAVGYAGAPMAGTAGAFWLLANGRGLSLHLQACKEGGCPKAGWDRKLCPGRHLRPVAAPGGSSGGWQRDSPPDSAEAQDPVCQPGLLLWAWAGPWTIAPLLLWPWEVLVLFSWILPLRGRGFSRLHGCCQ